MKRGLKLEKDDILRLKEMLDNYQDGDVLLMSQNSDHTDSIFAFVRPTAGVETLGPYDVVVMDGFDQFGIPLGEYNAACGCRLKGRSLLSACEEHKWISERAVTSLMIPKLGEAMSKLTAENLKPSLGEMLKMAYSPMETTEGPPFTHVVINAPVVDVNHFDTWYSDLHNLCAICGAANNHYGVPHGVATGDGLGRQDIIDYLNGRPFNYERTPW